MFDDDDYDDGSWDGIEYLIYGFGVYTAIIFAAGIVMGYMIR